MLWPMNLLDWVVGILFILSELIIIIKCEIGLCRFVRILKGRWKWYKGIIVVLCVIGFDYWFVRILKDQWK
jgi:hypothetical protein